MTQRTYQLVSAMQDEPMHHTFASCVPNALGIVAEAFRMMIGTPSLSICCPFRHKLEELSGLLQVLRTPCGSAMQICEILHMDNTLWNKCNRCITGISFRVHCNRRYLSTSMSNMHWYCDGWQVDQIERSPRRAVSK